MKKTDRLYPLFSAIEHLEIVYPTGFEEAILGTTTHENPEGEDNTYLILSTQKCIDILMEDMTHEEAVDYFYYNIEGSGYKNRCVFLKDVELY